jgi:hypothetical protein
MGDVVYSIPCVQAFAEKFGPVDLYLGISERDGHFGGKHFSRAKVEWLMPLLAAQPCIHSVQVYTGQKLDLDLNLFRKLPIDFRAGDLATWYRWAFPVDYDLTQQWLHVEAEPNNEIVVNRSARYNNPDINYGFLTGRSVVFVGVDDEYKSFVAQVPDAVHHPVASALELAKLISGCRLFVGNQSCPFAIAEALKVNRVLEVFPRAPNVLVHGPGGFDAVTQLGFEWQVARLLA